MRTTASVLTLIVAVLLLAALPSMADVYNVDLSSVENSGVSGTASTISSRISGATPFSMVEVNARVNQAPTANMVYEGWLIDNDTNTKQSLGAFNGVQLNARLNLVQFGATGPFDAIAVSMEPVGDVSPMPGTIVAMGNLPGNMVTAADFTRVAVLPADEMFQRQVVMQRFGLTDEQISDLRMQGWAYSDIAVVANAAVRCNRSPSSIANMLAQGQSWQQIAQDYNTTVALLLEPVPAQAVAGFRGEIQPGVTQPGMVQPLTVYLRYPNGRPVVTEETWEQCRRRGYSWRDVAVAANIASMTGEDVGTLLRMTRITGVTWRQMAIERGLDFDRMLDVSRWPFSRNGEPMVSPVPPMGGTMMPTVPGGPSY